MNKKWLYIMQSLNIVLIFLIGLVRTKYMCAAFTFSIIPLVASCIMLKDQELHLCREKRISVWSFLLTGLFMFMLSAESAFRMLLTMDYEPIHLVFKILYFPLTMIAVYICSYYTLQKAMKNGMRPAEETKEQQGKKETGYKCMGLYKPTWIIVAVVAVFTLAYYPGEIGWDIYNMMNVAASGSLSDWHTVSFMLLMEGCMALFGGIFGLTLVQAVCFILVENYAIGYLYHRFSSQGEKIARVYAILSVSIGIIAYRYIPTLCKDITFYEAVFAFSIAVLYYLQKDRGNWKDYTSMAVFGLFSSLFRHMAIIIVMITLIVVAISRLRTKRAECYKILAIIPIPVVGFILVVNVLAFGILGAEKNPGYIKYSIPMNMVGAMAYRSVETGEAISEESMKIMERIMPLSQWVEAYNKYDSDIIGRPSGIVGDNIYKLNDPQNGKDILLLNVRYLMQNPKSYLVSYFDITSLVWEITSPVDGVVYTPINYGDFSKVLHMRKGCFFYLSESISAYLSENSVTVAIVMRGGLSVFALLLFSVLYILKKRMREWIAMLPIMLYTAMLMVSIPQPQTRYVFAITQYAIFFGVYIWYERSKNQTTTSE